MEKTDIQFFRIYDPSIILDFFRRGLTIAMRSILDSLDDLIRWRHGGGWHLRSVSSLLQEPVLVFNRDHLEWSL